ncbi:MAG: carboxymuconolactone decarboxylase family protein [Candidatus Cloacimonetes bacterium]|nr:carboxymuconolactone decarboxylase family protein [Candidatus Cloacimonadota bacterium]
MTRRIDYGKAAPGVYRAMGALDDYLETSGIEPVIAHMVRLRASQINGCAYCIDMHWKDLRALGESEQRLYSLRVWRECPWYSDRERAALAWTEAVTRVEEGVPDDVYEEVRQHFTETELANLTLAIATINAWNRLSIAARLEPGTYRSSLQPLEVAAV